MHSLSRGIRILPVPPLSPLLILLPSFLPVFLFRISLPAPTSIVASFSLFKYPEDQAACIRCSFFMSPLLYIFFSPSRFLSLSISVARSEIVRVVIPKATPWLLGRIYTRLYHCKWSWEEGEGVALMMSRSDKGYGLLRASAAERFLQSNS